MQANVAELSLEVAASKTQSKMLPNLQYRLEELNSLIHAIQRSISASEARPDGLNATNDRLQELSHAVDAEILKRCTDVSDLHAKLAHEVAHVIGLIEVQQEDMKEMIAAQHVGLRSWMDGKYSSQPQEAHVAFHTSSPAQSAGSRAVQDEETAHIQQDTELLNTLQTNVGNERQARMNEVSATRADLIQAVVKEREERIIENDDGQQGISKAMQQ